MRIIFLTGAKAQGRYAIVDSADFERINQHRWRVLEGSTGKLYAIRTARRRTIYMAREVLGDPRGDVDHVNGNTLDNRKDNLRVCEHVENMWNQGVRKSNTSGYKGVSQRPGGGKWVAHIGFKGKKISLGTFDTPEEGAAAYDAAARRFHGRYAKVNDEGNTAVLDVSKLPSLYHRPRRNRYGRGVHKRGNTYQAFIRGKNIGSFRTAEEAARAYDQAAVNEYGSAALLNHPQLQAA